MRRYACVATLALAIATSSADAKEADAGSIRYGFDTLLVPGDPAERTHTVDKKDAWFVGKAVPAGAVVLDAPVAIPKTKAVLEKGLPLSIATSSYFIACQQGLSVTAGLFGGGKASVCLIDYDRDGVLDSWFRSSVATIWSEYHGNIQRDDIYPIGPIAATRLTPEQVDDLEPWTVYALRYVGGRLTYCIGLGYTCLTNGPKIEPMASEQTVEFVGGEYGFALFADGRLNIRMIRDPHKMVFVRGGLVAPAP